MYDELESLEAAAERWANNNVKGEYFDCPGCGKPTHLAEGVASTPNPYSAPICPDCAERRYDDRR